MKIWQGKYLAISFRRGIYMTRIMKRPKIIVKSFYGSRENEKVLKEYIKCFISLNDILKSSLDTIAISNLMQYNSLKMKEEAIQ